MAESAVRLGDTVRRPVDGWSSAVHTLVQQGTFAHPADDAKIDTLRSVTCGSLTLDDAAGID